MGTEDLEKMAIADIRPGKKLDLGDDHVAWHAYDYSHLLPPQFQKTHKIVITHRDGFHNVVALLHKKDAHPMDRQNHLGVLDAEHWGYEKAINIQVARIHASMRDHGVGAAMYEAVMAHAKHVLGAKTVVGDVHSTLAHNVHQKLSAKHGMNYSADPHFGTGTLHPTKEEWKQAEPAPFDEKYGPYSYTIKGELPMEKSLSMAHIAKIVRRVQDSLSDDLRKPRYRGHENCLAGHCYVASEALYHLLGGHHSGWVPQTVQHEGGPHWYLKHKFSGAIVDPTATQFETPVPYDKGVGKGFLTRQPSKRTQVVLDRVARGPSLAKAEPLGKMAMIHNDANAPKFVYRIANAKGIGPYGANGTGEEDGSPQLWTPSFDHWSDGHRPPGMPNTIDIQRPPPFWDDRDFTHPEEKHAQTQGLLFGFENPYDAVEWFGDKNLAHMASNGYALHKVPASQVFRSHSGRQLMFQPHHSYDPATAERIPHEQILAAPKTPKGRTVWRSDPRNELPLESPPEAFVKKSEDLEKGVNGDWSADPNYRFEIVDGDKQYSLLSKVNVYHGDKHVGKLHFSTGPRYDPTSPDHGYHDVSFGSILPEHQGRGLYQEMLRRATEHVQSKGSAGLKSGASQQSQMSNRVWEKVATHTSATPHWSKKRAQTYYKKSEDEFATDEKVVACVAVFNPEGLLLMGQRNDSKKWNCPGGKAEPGERPEDCARREVLEETGLEIKRLQHLATGWGGKNGDIRIYAFKAVADGVPDASGDPDKECDDWEWVDVRAGLPEEFNADTLHNGSSDVLLQALGLQEASTGVGELSKSWKHAFAGAIAAASIYAGDAAAGSKWKPDGLAEGLHPIAHLESSFGKRMNHAPHSKGDYHTAYGACGLKAVTAHEEYKRTPWLQKMFPNLHDATKFTETLKSNHALYNHAATAHWNRLKKLFGGDRLKAAYAWRWGPGAARRDAPEVQAADPYVLAYQKLWDKMQGQKIAQNMENPLAKYAQEWLVKASGRQAFKSKDGITIPADGTAARHRYDADFEAQLHQVFGARNGKTLKPVRVPLDAIVGGTNSAVNTDRLDLYRRMARQDRLPPVVVRRAGDGFYVVDGNHRHAGAVAAGLRALDAFEITDDKPVPGVKKELPKHLKLYNLADDPEGFMEPKFRETEYGMVYEPTEMPDIEKQLKRKGYHGYHGHTEDPNHYVTFPGVPKSVAMPEVGDKKTA